MRFVRCVELWLSGIEAQIRRRVMSGRTMMPGALSESPAVGMVMCTSCGMVIE